MSLVFHDKLAPLRGLPHIGDVRGRGLLAGIEFVADKGSKAPFPRARKFADERGLDCIGGTEVGEDVLHRWEAVLTSLERDPGELASQLDWVAKHRLIDGYRERHGLQWDDARLAAMDLFTADDARRDHAGGDAGHSGLDAPAVAR